MVRRAAIGEGSVYRRKDGRYAAAAYLMVTGGKKKRLSFYGATRQEAQAKLVRAKAQALQGIPLPGTSWKLAAYLDYWLECTVKVKKRPKTYELYELTVRRYLKPGLGTRLLTNLTVAAVQDFLDEQLAAGHSKRKVQVMRTVLSAALTRAMHEELLQRNVARLVELPTWKRKPIHPWSADEAKLFLNLVENHPLCAAFVLLLLYGLRRGEALGLRWCDIDFNEGELHIRQQLQRIARQLQLSPLKTDAGERDLPLVGLAAAVLTAQRARQDAARAKAGRTWHGSANETELVFTTATGEPVDPDGFTALFHQLQHQHQLRPVKLHHLRHTTATLLKNLNVPDRDAQFILGHAQISTTQAIYQHDDMNTRREAIAKVESIYLRTIDRTWGRIKQPLSELLSIPSASTYLQRFISGGPGGTRTLDILLKRSAWHTETDPLTTTIVVLKVQTMQWLLGRIAVKHSGHVFTTQPVGNPRAIWTRVHKWMELRL